MEIYGAMLSPFMARVVLAARFKGIKHKVLMPKDGIKSPAFLKMNPLGKMPVVKDGSTVLFESAVIVEYLEAKYKRKRIVPSAAKAGAQARLIGAIFDEYAQAAILALFPHIDPAKRDQAVVDAKLAELSKALDIVEKMISAKPYAAGAKFTIADCYAVPALFFVVTFAPRFGVADPLGGRKKLAKYLAKARKDKLLGGVLTEMEIGLKQWESAKS
ncbi:MAG: glutathione S-transferase family protein [Rhodospirillaceae bacterium]|nr:glutathione S-transferase family protein [Rhodospirillaceae bacterium]